MRTKLSQLHQIEDALYRHPHQIGLVLGGSKTRIGTPDRLLQESDGRYVLVEYVTHGKPPQSGKLGGEVNGRFREIAPAFHE